MAEAHRWIPQEQQVNLQRQTHGTDRRDLADPSGPADVVAGWDHDHWHAPRDYGALANAAGQAGARDMWAGPRVSGPTATPPPGRYRYDLTVPPLELHDADQLVGGHGYSGWARQAQAAQRGPKNYRRSDERILEDLCETVIAASYLDATEVTVEVNEGKVKLEGTVPDRRMKHAIEDIAAATAGVTDVENRIRVA